MKRKVIFFCTFPNQVRGFTGANIGNHVTYTILKDNLDITIIDLGIKSFNPQNFNWAHVIYNFKIFFHYIYKIYLLRKHLKRQHYNYLYFLPGSALKGHLRDIFTVWIARPFVERIIGHNRNGNFADINKRKWHQPLTKYFINSVDKFIFLSNNLRDLTCKFIDTDKTAVIFNPIDNEIVFTVEEINEKISSRKNRQIIQILFLSNMIPAKGYKDVLMAADVLVKRGFINFKIDFIGRWNNKKDEDEAIQFIENKFLQNYITLHGKITDRGYIRFALLQSDIFVLPTYYPVEAQPRSIIEALNAGTPIIATCHASIPEMIESGIDCLFVKKNNPVDIADAIMKFEDYNIWKAFSHNCKRTFESKFSHNTIKNQLLSVFYNS